MYGNIDPDSLQCNESRTHLKIKEERETVLLLVHCACPCT